MYCSTVVHVYTIYLLGTISYLERGVGRGRWGESLAGGEKGESMHAHLSGCGNHARLRTAFPYIQCRVCMCVWLMHVRDHFLPITEDW